MLVLLYIFDESVSELDQEGIKQVQVLLEHSLVVIHDNGFKDMVTDLDYVDHLLEDL